MEGKTVDNEIIVEKGDIIILDIFRKDKGDSHTHIIVNKKAKIIVVYDDEE